MSNTTLPSWALNTEPHPTDRTKVLAPFDLDAAKAGVPICSPLGKPLTFVAFAQNARKVCVGSCDSEAGWLCDSVDPEYIRLLLPALPEGWALVKAGEKPVERVMTRTTSTEWFEVEFPTFAQFERGNIYARKLPACALCNDTGKTDGALGYNGQGPCPKCSPVAELQYTGEAHCIKCGKTHWLGRECPAVDDAGGWIKWHGGECPVANGTRIDYKLRNGYEGQHQTADCYRWDHKNKAGDIIAYRVVESAPAENPRVPLIPPPLTIADVDERIARALDKLANDARLSSWIREACSSAASELQKAPQQ